MGKKWTQNEFIEYVSNLHTKIRKQYNLPPFDYSETIFIGLSNFITYKCPLHPDEKIIQLANSHKRKHGGCSKCNNIILHFNNKLSNTEEFINKALKIKKHINDDGTPKYDYSHVKYFNAMSFVDIYCPKHDNLFKISPNEHLQGNGCKFCALESRSIKTRYTQEEFINKCKIKQNNIRKLKNLKPYDYSKTIFNGTNNKCIFICSEHGEFEQLAESHLQGFEGCKKCKELFGYGTSLIENEIINFLKENNIIIQIRNKQIIKPKELDIYIPDKNLAIEFNGLYHHSELYKSKNYHIEKTEACEKQGIQLIHIFEDEWLEKQEIVKSRLLNILGLSKWRLYARNLKIKQVSVSLEKYFFNRNHLQGYIPSQLCYGLFWLHEGKEYLVSAMSFGDLRKNLGSTYELKTYEMYRFCNALNYSIPGAAQKLFKHFLKQINPRKVISYADRRWSINNKHNLYNQLGFEFINNTKIGYDYVYGNKRFNRFMFTKSKCIEMGCSKEMSEHEFMNNIGYLQIYDCGQLKYKYQR